MPTRFEAAAYSDAGRVKDSNQDSFLVEVADTPQGQVALAAIADGMGGLKKGELASATALRGFAAWFERKLPLSLEAMGSSGEGFQQFVRGQWSGLVQDLSLSLIRHGAQEGMNLGTTLSALLAIDGRYTIAHVGDTRIYELTNRSIRLMTKDQTLVQRELDAGLLEPEQAADHPQRHVLLQCIGSTKEVRPQMLHGKLKRKATYLLCSDGFRHEVSEKELHEALRPSALAWPSEDARSDKEAPEEALARLAALAMDRGEDDNLTAVVLHVEGDGRP